MANTITPPIAPAMTVIFSILEAYTFDFSRSPFPITFPRRIVPALAMAKQKTEPILRTTVTSELAATASVPRCPRITEYMENATLHETSFPSAGSDNLMKSRNNTLLRINIYVRFSFTFLLREDTITQAINSMNLEEAVAIATPVAPSFGAPNSPKIKVAFRIMFRTKASIFKAILIVTRPTLRRIAR